MDPVEPCLDAHGEPPAELAAMLSVLRDVPLGWLRAADALLDRLDRPERLERLYITAIERARILSLTAASPAALAATTPAAPAASAQQLALAWGDLGRRFVAARAELGPRLVVGRGWREIRQRALRELSLDDLIESGRNQPALVKLASAELERIERVATCLHDASSRPTSGSPGSRSSACSTPRPTSTASTGCRASPTARPPCGASWSVSCSGCSIV